MRPLIKANEILSQRIPKKAWSKFILSPLLRIIIAFIFLSPVFILHIIFIKYVLNGTEEPLNSILYFIETIILIILLYFAYSLYTRYIENRKALEFSTGKWIPEYAVGLATGSGVIVFLVLLLSVLGFYRAEHVNSVFILITGIFRYSIGAFIEELIFTLIFFKLVEEFAGSKVSIVVTSLLFGLLHLGNDNASVQSSLVTAVAHIFLLAPFILTRRIWFIWALHFSWNFFQAGVFGMNNSGMVQDGFITSVVTGPQWITGGEYGVELSYISLAIQIIIGLLILKQAIKSGQLVKASWKRR